MAGSTGSVRNPLTHRPPRRRVPRNQQPKVIRSRTRASTQPSTPLEPAVTLARSAAPPQQPGDPFQQRVEPVLSSAEATQQSPVRPSDHETRASAGIDWDAETAAALSGDGEAMHHASAPNALEAHAAPDQLLEDLIREIVGDAAVDTASSLHTPPPMTAGDEPLTQGPVPSESHRERGEPRGGDSRRSNETGRTSDGCGRSHRIRDPSHRVRDPHPPRHPLRRRAPKPPTSTRAPRISATATAGRR